MTWHKTSRTRRGHTHKPWQPAAPALGTHGLALDSRKLKHFECNHFKKPHQRLSTTARRACRYTLVSPSRAKNSNISNAIISKPQIRRRKVLYQTNTVNKSHPPRLQVHVRLALDRRQVLLLPDPLLPLALCIGSQLPLFVLRGVGVCNFS